MQILPDIFLVDGIRGANSYWISSLDGILVVDTGLPGQTDRIIESIGANGKRPADVKWIVLTHADIDHSGSVSPLRERTGAGIAAHAVEAQVLAGTRPGKQPKGILRLVFKILRWIRPASRNFSVDRFLGDGDAIAGWKVVHTPGHTEGSICLYRAGKVLIAGDALRCDTQGNPLPPSEMMSADMAAAMRSVERIAGLEFEAMLPGHGAPCLRQASRKVAALVNR